MKKIFKYFTPKENVVIFEKLKTKAYITVSIISFFVLILLITKALVFEDKNTVKTFFSALSLIIFILIGLFALKNSGIKKAGNILSFGFVVILAIPMNMMNSDIPSMYKYFQSFYSILALLSLSVLFASRKILLLNTFIIIVSTTRVWLFAIEQSPEFQNILTTGYIHNTITILVIATILYFTIKFGEKAIDEANENTKAKEIKIQELASSEEEIRASLEELETTTDALEESYSELEKAKDKADESNRLKSIFLSNISHEIRTPLNGIVGFSDLLNREDYKNKDTKLYTEVITKSSQQLLKVVDNILEVSQLESKEGRVFKTNFNINKLLGEIANRYEGFANTRSNKLLINNTLSDKESYIYTDRNKLYKIICNLTENAIKFTNKGTVKIIVKLNNNKIEFYIEDTGVGINQKNSLNIFDKFVQADESIASNYGGLGIGLTIAKHNIELLNGKIFSESSSGKGSMFYFNINYTQAIEENSKTNIVSKGKITPTKNKQHKILIVDDEIVNILIINKLLEKTGFNCKIFEAENGQEAIEIFKNNPDIALILMDKKMPIMTGCEAANKIRKLDPNINIVMQSAYIEDKEKESAFKAGCKEFLNKPIRRTDLENVLKKYLR